MNSSDNLPNNILVNSSPNCNLTSSVHCSTDNTDLYYDEQLYDHGKFDIRNFWNSLEDSTEHKGYKKCPACGKNKLGYNLNHTDPNSPPGYQCFTSGCDPQDIREAIRPYEEYLKCAKGINQYKPVAKTEDKKEQEDILFPDKILEFAHYPETYQYEPPKSHIEMEVVPDSLKGLKTTEVVVGHIPEKFKNLGANSVHVTTYNYENNRWVERRKFSAGGEQIREKIFYQYHIAKKGEKLASKTWYKPEDKTWYKPGGHTVPEGSEYTCKGGETVRTKGEELWSAYNETEIFRCKGKILLLVEGEKKVELLKEMGLIAISFQGSSWTGAEVERLMSLAKSAEIAGIFQIVDNDAQQ